MGGENQEEKMEAIDPFEDLFWSFRWELFRAEPNFDDRDGAETRKASIESGCCSFDI